MDKKGISSSTDIIIFALIISILSLLLIGTSFSERSEKYPIYAERVAQNTLIVLQKVPVKEFKTLDYTSDLPVIYSSTRKIRKKSLTQLIVEDVLLNPKTEDDKPFFSARNQAYSIALEKSLEKALDKIVGKSFGYRLIIKLKPIRISKKRLLCYSKTVQNFDINSKKLCSESTSLSHSIPSRWLKKDFNTEKIFNPENKSIKKINLLLTLELWSR